MISSLYNGRYNIEKEIGFGSICTVYQATCVKFGKVAVKAIDLRFKSVPDICSGIQEARLLSACEGHPNIVGLLESFIDEDKSIFW